MIRTTICLAIFAGLNAAEGKYMECGEGVEACGVLALMTGLGSGVQNVSGGAVYGKYFISNLSFVPKHMKVTLRRSFTAFGLRLLLMAPRSAFRRATPGFPRPFIRATRARRKT